MGIDENIEHKIDLLLKEHDESLKNLCLEEVLMDSILCRRLEKRINQIAPIKIQYEIYLLLIEKYNKTKNDTINEFIDLKNLENEIKNQAEELTKLVYMLDSKTEKATVEIGPITNKNIQFAKNIFLGYKNYCNNNQYEIYNLIENINFYKFDIVGKNCLKQFVNENGIHKTDESSVFVLVYPYVDKEDISFEEKDLKVDVYRSNGAGGQNVNKVSTAIRITHLPTNIVATCQDERSQFQNKERALANLKEKVNKFLENKYEKNLKKLKDKYSNKTIIKKYDIQNNLIVNISTKQKIYLQDFVAGKKL